MDDDEDLSDDERMQICEICQIERFYILKHLKESKECKEKYSSEGLNKLKKIARKRRNMRRRGRYNSASESKRKKESYDAAKVSERNKKYWEKNKAELKKKMLAKYHHKFQRYKVSMNTAPTGEFLMRSTLLLKHFDLRDGPNYHCICCSKLKYEDGVTDANELQTHVEKHVIEKYVHVQDSSPENSWICHNCFWHLKYYETKPNSDPFAPFCLPKHRHDFRTFNLRCPELSILFSVFTLQKMPQQLLKTFKEMKHAQVVDNRQYPDSEKTPDFDYKTKCYGFLLTFGDWNNPEEEESPFHLFKHCLCYLEVSSNGTVSFELANKKPKSFDASIWMQKKVELGYLAIKEIKPALELMDCADTEQEKNYLNQNGFDDLAFLYEWEKI